MLSRLKQETYTIIAATYVLNYITRHTSRKQTNQPAGICRWAVKMVLTGLGIRKYRSLELALYMFTIPCISIIFSSCLFICYACIACGSAHVFQLEFDVLHLSCTLIFSHVGLTEIDNLYKIC